MTSLPGCRAYPANFVFDRHSPLEFQVQVVFEDIALATMAGPSRYFITRYLEAAGQDMSFAKPGSSQVKVPWAWLMS